MMNTTWLIIWLVLFVIMIVIEMITTGATAVWFGCGMLVGAIMAAIGAPVWLQIIAFAVSTFLLYAFVRPSVKRKLDRTRKVVKDRRLVGSRALVISEIDNLRGIGEIRIANREWAAKSVERGVVIPEGSIARVIDVEGDIMIVCMDSSVSANMKVRDSEARLDPNLRE